MLPHSKTRVTSRHTFETKAPTTRICSGVNLRLITTVVGPAYGPAPVVAEAVRVQHQGLVAQAALRPALPLAPPVVLADVVVVVERAARPRALGLVPVAVPQVAEGVVLLHA